MTPIEWRKQVLFVDCNAQFAEEVRRECDAFANFEVVTSFPAARRRVLQGDVALLVTNIRLDEYNGLHLVYLSTIHGHQTRCLVYSSQMDQRLVEEAQAAGALYEPASTLIHALPSYIAGPLPTCDRRLPREADRRQVFRGGRRGADLAFATC